MFERLCTFAAFTVALLSSQVALADMTLKESVISQSLGMVIQTLGAALGVLLLILVRKAIVYFEKKTKVEIPAKVEEVILSIAQKSIDYATEKAYQYTKDKGSKMPSEDKMTVALQFGLEVIREQGLQDVAKDKFVKYIEAKLGATRTPTE